MATDASSRRTEGLPHKSALVSLPPELRSTIVALLDRPALWSLLVTCRSLKLHAEHKIYETFYLRRYIRTKAVVFRAVERIIDNPDLAMRVRRLDLRATWSTNNLMFVKLAPRLRAALHATKQLQTLAFPHDFPGGCYRRALPDVALPRLQHLNIHHVCYSEKGWGGEVLMTHDTIPWIRKHIGPLTHIELRSTCYDSAEEQADLLLDTTESQMPIVDAQYFRSSGSILAALLSHSLAGTADRKKLAQGGTVHVQPLDVDPAFTPEFLDALTRSDHIIGALVIDMEAVSCASDRYDIDYDSETWTLESLSRIVITTSEEDARCIYNVENLISIHTNLFKILHTPALEMLEIASLFPIPHARRLVDSLCRQLGPSCPALHAIKANSVTRVRISADGPWGVGCWPGGAPPCWPFDAPAGFEERPRRWDPACCEERRGVKTAGETRRLLYDVRDFEHFETYGPGDEDYGRPDDPETGWWGTEDEKEEVSEGDTTGEEEEESEGDTADEEENTDKEKIGGGESDSA